MANNRLILRKMISPWVTQHMDITRSTTLTHVELDSNFVYLKGEVITSASVDGNTLTLNKINGNTIEVDIEGLSGDTGQTLSLINKLKGDLDEDALWEVGSAGLKSIKRKNSSDIDSVGDYSLSQGKDTMASGHYSHAEGANTIASGDGSHSGGIDATASGDVAFSHSNKSQAEGDYSAVVGGRGNLVESGGQSSGVYVGMGNEITGINYSNLIAKLETELETLTYIRTLEHEEYNTFVEESKGSIDSKLALIKSLEDAIDTLNSDINQINDKIKGLTDIDPDDPKILELVTLKGVKEAELVSKQKEVSMLSFEVDEIEESVKTAQEVESNAISSFQESVSKLQKQINYYKSILSNGDAHAPVQSAIIGGKENTISKSSDSIIGAGSENILEIEVKNSGIFAGVENKINGGDYSELIVDLQEELSSAIKIYNSELAKKQQEIKILEEQLASNKALLLEENKKENPDSDLIAKLGASIKSLEDKLVELKTELKILSDNHDTFVMVTQEKISSLQKISENDEYAPVDNSAIIAGKGNQISVLSDNSVIVGGRSNKINNLSNSVVVGGQGITAKLNNTVYTPNLNIKVQPSRDNSVTQVLVRDSDGYIKYKDVSSFTDLSVVGGDYNVQTGVVTLTNNDGNSFDISGFSKNMTDSYTTNAYIEDGVMYFDNNVHGPKYYQVNVNELINVIIDRGDCSEEQYSQYLKLANEYESINDKKIKHEDELVELEGDVSELYKLINTLKIQLDSLDPEQDADQIAKLVAQLKIYKNSVLEKLKLITVSKDKIKLLSSNSILEFATYMPINESNFNCWARTQIINIIGYEDRGSCSSEKYSEYVKLANHYSLTKQEYDLLVVRDSELTIQITQIEDDINAIIKQISAIEEAIKNTDNQELIAQLTKQLNALKIQLESFTAQLKKIKNESLSVKDVLEKIEKSKVLDFGAYMPINEVNFDCWKDSQLLSMIEECCVEDEKGPCADKKWETYENLGNTYLQYINIKSDIGVTDEDIENKESEMAKLISSVGYIPKSKALLYPIDSVSGADINQADKFMVAESKNGVNNPGDGDGDVAERGRFSEWWCCRIQGNPACCYVWGKKLFANLEDLSLDDVLDTNIGGRIGLLQNEIDRLIKGSVEKGVFNKNSTPSGFSAMLLELTKMTETNQALYNLYKKASVKIDNGESIDWDSENKDFNRYLKELEDGSNRLQIELDADSSLDADGNIQNFINDLNLKTTDFDSEIQTLLDELKQLNSKRDQLTDLLNDLVVNNFDIAEFGDYMPINDTNFDCWSEQQIIDTIGYEDRGACSEDDYNTYVKMGQKVLTENESIQTLQLSLSENQKTLKTYRDRIAELEAMPQPLPDDLQKELNVLIEDGYSLEAQIKIDSEIIKTWLESDEYNFMTQYMPINEVNFICWKHSQLLSIIEECCKDDVRGDCSDDKYSQYLKLANEYSTTKDLFDTTTETQTQLTILINEGVTTISEKEAQLLKLKKQLEDLLNSGGNPDLPFDVNSAISNIDELLTINTEYDINLGLWNNGIGSTEEDFNNRKSTLLDSLNKMLEKSDELETLLHLTFGSPSYGTEYGIKEELKLHLRDIKGNTNASGSGTGILQAAIATVNAQTWTGDYSGWGDWMVDIINPLIVQSISSTSSIQSHLTNIKNKINAANANPGNGDNDELVAALQKQIASLTKELEDLTKVLDANKKQLLVVEEQLINITNSGVLQFEIYMPINEVNFDCWSEQLIIDAVGYEDRGECSLKSYTEYTAEADNYKKIKKHYDDLIKEQSELMTQVAQFKTDISDLKANISSLENLISNLDPETDSEEIARLTKQLNAYKIQLENFTAQLSQIEADLSRTNERIEIILDSGELDFVAYMPVNEVNFDCWTEAKLYNELNVKIESITSNVGYDERGDCSDDKYQKYLKLANQYDSVKKSYDDSKATEQQLSDDIINLQVLIATSELSVVDKNHVKNTLEVTKADLEAEKAKLQQILEDLLNAPGEDLFEIEVANKLSKVLIAQIAQMGGVISQKTEQQTDVEFFTQYKESLQASVGDIDDLIDALKKMMISEVTEDYVGKNAIETILNNILSELSKIAQILVSDFSNEAYRRLVAHHKYLVELAGELQEGIGSVEFPPSDNSEEIANCEEQIKTITTQIASTNSQIFTITEEIVILDNEISGYKVQLQTYKVDYSTAQENIEVIETSGILQFEVYMPINEVNFDCWSEQLIIDAVGYEDRGDCSLKSYTEYTAESKNYEATKEQYDLLIEQQSELMTQVVQFKTNIADLIAARASKKTELDRLKSEDPNSPLIPVLEEEIKQLDRDIEDFTAQLSQKENDLSRTNERIQIIIDSGDLDFVVYMPVNEVNFDCWSEQMIIDVVGYEDRGQCSSKMWKMYEKLYDDSIRQKAEVDKFKEDIISLQDTLLDINNQISEINDGGITPEEQKLYNSLIGQKKVIDDQITFLQGSVDDWENGDDDDASKGGYKFLSNYAPLNEANFTCWRDTFFYEAANEKIENIIDAVGYDDRGQCSLDSYTQYTTKAKVYEATKEQYDLLIEQQSELMIQITQFKTDIADLIAARAFKQTELNTLKSEDPNSPLIPVLEEEIKQLDRDIEDFTTQLSQKENDLLMTNEQIQIIVNSGDLDFVVYMPVNEVNFICYVNNLQNDKIDKLIEDNEYKIYNIESQLNNSSLDNEGTFNYYPNVYDDFSGNPKFSVGNFDELDSIINLSSNDLVTWGKLVCNGGVGGTIMKNLITSIRCIESLENEITSIEAEESNDFGNLKHIYESEIQNLRSQQQSDPRLTTDLLEVKLSNMINERSVNSDLNAYMVDKLREVLEIYKQVNAIAADFCDNGGA